MTVAAIEPDSGEVFLFRTLWHAAKWKDEDYKRRMRFGLHEANWPTGFSEQEQLKMTESFEAYQFCEQPFGSRGAFCERTRGHEKTDSIGHDAVIRY